MTGKTPEVRSGKRKQRKERGEWEKREKQREKEREKEKKRETRPHTTVQNSDVQNCIV